MRIVPDLPLKTVLNYFVAEGISSDRDKSKEVILHFLGDSLMTEGMLSQNEFKKMF